MASARGSLAALARKLVPRSNMTAALLRNCSCQFGSGFDGGCNDGCVTGAAAEMSAQQIPDLRLGRIGIAAQEGIERHQNARRTEAALQRVVAAERSLQDRQPVRRR